MHYKNGRPVNIGDWVVGISHNSDNQTVCGYVIGIMEDQGPCNIKILRWREENFTEEGNPVMIPIESATPREDYGDAKDFIRADDGLKAVSAIIEHASWNSPYSKLTPYIY